MTVIFIKVFGHIIQIVRAVIGVIGLRAAVVVVVIANDIAVDIRRARQPGIDILGRLTVGHDDNVIFLTSFLHGGRIGDTGVVPAAHAREIKPGFGQGFCQGRPAIGINIANFGDQRSFVGAAGRHQLAALVPVEFHQTEAHPGGVVNQIGDHLLGDFDPAFGLPYSGFIIIHKIAHAQASTRTTAGITG